MIYIHMFSLVSFIFGFCALFGLSLKWSVVPISILHQGPCGCFRSG